jgi:hypothetical protein
MANQIFKSLKTSLEGVKDAIKVIEDRKAHKQEMCDL